MEMSFSKRQSKTIENHTDTHELDHLFNQHWERICNVLYRLLGDLDEAEDIALETFLRLYQRPPRRKDNLGGWLYRVATNLGLNALRSRKRRQLYEQQIDPISLMERSMENPAEIYERKQERQNVQAVLSSMKPRSAQILVLRHSGFAYAEIAEALGISPGSVGTLLSRAEKEFERLYEVATG